MEQKLHLDSEYRRRWVEFHLLDDTIINSKEKNWRDVEWDQVVKVVVNMNGIINYIDSENKDNFKGFLNFRYGGREAQFDDETGKQKGFKTINSWIIGWTDGDFAYLKEIDFYSGKLIKEFKEPLHILKAHIHDKIKDKIKL